MSDHILFRDLPPLRAPLDIGSFYGLTTLPNGKHYAVMLLDARPDKRLTWKQAVAWAKKIGGAPPTRSVSALLYVLAKDQFEEAWYWTADELDGSSAWYQYFANGDQFILAKICEARAVAVRLIEVVA